MRTTCDANLLVRAMLHQKGLARAIVDLATQSPHVLVLSQPLIDDVRRVLQYDRIQKRYNMSDADIDDFAAFLHGVSDVVIQPTLVPVVMADPDDDLVIATAVDGRAEAICTLDHHLADPAVVAYCAARGIRILTDIQLVQELRAA